jgi:ubiquinone/menaquinone biosynthesis C-methylase UbiE/uncharacterized protein YbaR (Trm112 family)
VKLNLLNYLRCPETNTENLKLEIFEETTEKEIISGRLVTSNPSIWYKIDGGIVDMLPAGLRNEDRYRLFCKKWNLDLPAGIAKDREFAPQKVQINFFKEDSKVYDRDVTNLLFYQASDKICLDGWIQNLSTEAVILDVGGGTGRQAVPLAKHGNQVVSFDISEEMLLIAQQKVKKEGLGHKVDFVLADASSFPFKTQSFDAAICYGVLHHVPKPSQTISETGRVLKKNSKWYSYDPHASPARFIFEIAMKIKKLYAEEDGGQPPLTGRDLVKWCKDAGIESKIKYHTYLLPHFLGFMSFNQAYRTLKASDAIFTRMPGMRKLAGIVISEGKKH